MRSPCAAASRRGARKRAPAGFQKLSSVLWVAPWSATPSRFAAVRRAPSQVWAAAIGDHGVWWSPVHPVGSKMNTSPTLARAAWVSWTTSALIDVESTGPSHSRIAGTISPVLLPDCAGPTPSTDTRRSAAISLPVVPPSVIRPLRARRCAARRARRDAPTRRAVATAARRLTHASRTSSRDGARARAALRARARPAARSGPGQLLARAAAGQASGVRKLRGQAREDPQRVAEPEGDRAAVGEQAGDRGGEPDDRERRDEHDAEPPAPHRHRGARGLLIAALRRARLAALR